MIRVEDLAVSYGAVRALRGVSFVAESGKVTAVIGSNGAGKTTLLRTISGLVPAQGGSIRLDDVELLGRQTESIARLGVGHVPEGRGVIEDFTVLENLRLGALHGHVKFTEAVESQLAQFPALAERRKQHAGTLSGGERQMLAMARALIAGPTVLLLDEPSLGLAPLVTRDVMTTVRSLCDDRGLTVILVEQNAMSALQIADNAVVLHVGAVAAADTADAVRSDENLRHYYLGVPT